LRGNPLERHDSAHDVDDPAVARIDDDGEARERAEAVVEIDARADPRLLEEDALREEFDEAAQARRYDSTDDGEGEVGRSPRKSWKKRAQEKGHRRGRGRGYGMKRDGD